MRHTTLTSTTEAEWTHSRFRTIMIASCIMARMASPRTENPLWGPSKTQQEHLAREMASRRLIYRKSIPCMNAAVSHMILSTVRRLLLGQGEGEGYCSFDQATLLAQNQQPKLPKRKAVYWSATTNNKRLPTLLIDCILYSIHHYLPSSVLLSLHCPHVTTFVFSVDTISSGRPGWSSWSDFGPCSSNCKKTRQRFCASSDKDKDCPGQSYGVESQEVVCPSQECKGEWKVWVEGSETVREGIEVSTVQATHMTKERQIKR